MRDLYEFYLENQDEIENQFSEYISRNDWGSGDDRIKITDKIFWEFVEELQDECN